MAFQIEVTDDAELDADIILDWLIAQQVGETGLRWFRNMRKAIDTLANMPERCPLAPETAEFPFEVRQLLYGRRPHVYRILFTVDVDKVVVLHIRHGRRQHLT